MEQVLGDFFNFVVTNKHLQYAGQTGLCTFAVSTAILTVSQCIFDIVLKYVSQELESTVVAHSMASNEFEVQKLVAGSDEFRFLEIESKRELNEFEKQLREHDKLRHLELQKQVENFERKLQAYEKAQAKLVESRPFWRQVCLVAVPVVTSIAIVLAGAGSKVLGWVRS